MLAVLDITTIEVNPIPLESYHCDKLKITFMQEVFLEVFKDRIHISPGRGLPVLLITNKHGVVDSFCLLSQYDAMRLLDIGINTTPRGLSAI